MSEWFGSQIQTEATPMIDSGIGRPLILRTFEFAIKPNQQRKVTKQELFNAHWPYIRTLIWSDGLVANTDVEPRVVVGKKRYRIFILCEPKFRTLVADKPKTLQEVFKKLDK